MKVLGRDREKQSIRLRLDSLDDLWHVHELVESGDVATALTFRTAQTPGRDEGAGKAEKKRMVLGVRVEKSEFHPFTDRLRLLGVIVEGPQDMGSYHTINLDVGSDVTLAKPKGWRRHHEDRIQEAEAQTAKPLVTFLAIEDNEAVVAVLRQYGVQKMADIVGHASGKQYAASKGVESDFFDEVLMALRDYRPADAPLLVVGPGFAKERFLAYAREKQTTQAKGAAVEGTGQAGMTGIHEALKAGIVGRVARDSRVARETQLVERLFEAIAKDAPCTYGLDETRRALEAGAVDDLLVCDEQVREPSGEALLEAARAVGSTPHIISTHHEAGAKLQAMGGVGALLRFRI